MPSKQDRQDRVCCMLYLYSSCLLCCHILRGVFLQQNSMNPLNSLNFASIVGNCGGRLFPTRSLAEAITLGKQQPSGHTKATVVERCFPGGSPIT